MIDSIQVSDGWDECKLGDVAHIIDPHPSHRAPEQTSEGVPFAGIGDLTELGELLPGKARIVSAETLKEHANRYKLSGNSIGFGRVATIGKIIDFPDHISGIAVSPTMAIIEPHSINRDFLLCMLRSSAVKNTIDKWLTGTTRSSLGIELLRELPLARPKKDKQKQIGRIAKSINSAVEKTETLIRKYQKIKAGLMHDLFTRGFTADGKLRPPREQSPDLYQKTPIGWIPKEWEILQLEKVAQILDPQPDHRTPPEQTDGIPYIGIGDFDLNGELDTNGCRKIIKRAYEKQRRRFRTEKGDIIFGKIGTIGNPRILPDGSYALSANVLLFKPMINSSFLFQTLNTHYFNKQISNITNTTSQPALGIERVRILSISLPNNEMETDKISAILDSCDIKISNSFKYFQKLKMQKVGLMHDLLTGKVPVTIDKAITSHV